MFESKDFEAANAYVEEQRKTLPDISRNFLAMRRAREELKKKDQIRKKNAREKRYQKAVEDFQKAKRKAITGAIKNHFDKKKQEHEIQSELVPNKPPVAGISHIFISFIYCLLCSISITQPTKNNRRIEGPHCSCDFKQKICLGQSTG